MTVKELIADLSDVDGDRLVVVAADAEGNSYHELTDISKMLYNEGWGEVGLEELTEDDIEQGYGDEDVMRDGVKAVVLW